MSHLDVSTSGSLSAQLPLYYWPSKTGRTVIPARRGGQKCATVPAEPGMDTVSVYFTVTIRMKLDIKNFSDSFTATNLLNYEQYTNDFNK